jgi:tetratricopeptide (TPR) repeat protein
VNQKTSLKVDAERRITLSSGEVYAEVAPRSERDGTPFVIKTPVRDVSALGTRLDVRAEPAGTGVAVTQGQVKVSGVDGLLRAGQQVRPGAAALTPAPRASYLLDWARELMAAAEAPLVPESKYAGGALVATNQAGQESRLTLRKYHLDVHIEDGFVRTTIDQTYFNEENWRTEGTFYFPLPPEASLSRLAMYVDGTLMEGGMAERDHARNVYEQILYTRRDPALLEWVDGSTFKMRVFPLEGRQEKRIILSYTQRLPSLYGRTQYRFPAGHSLEAVRDWSFHARIKDGNKITWRCDSHRLKDTWDGRDLLLDGAARKVKVDRDVVLDLFANASAALDEDGVRFSSTEQEGARYLMVRYRPALPDRGARQPRHWIFLYESSADRDPLLARVQVEIIRMLLTNAEHTDTFSIVSAGTRVQYFADKPRTVTTENVRDAVEFLEQTHLIGALDLEQALGAVKPLVPAKRDTYLVHAGSGIAALGETREDLLAKHLPEGVKYIGVAVGKRWSRGFMKTAAERTGGYFTQINPDEQVGWRAFELSATLNTPRLLNVKVVDNTERLTFLSYASTIAQGEEICAITRAGPEMKAWPESVTITGTLDGKPFQRIVAVHPVRERADYLPRTWAKLEIDRLLAENSEANQAKIVELSKAMYVMTPFTSLLVLENEAMYKQFNVDRGRKDHWAMYACPAKIPVVYEPIQAPPQAQTQAAQAENGSEAVLRTILQRSGPRQIEWDAATGGVSDTILFGSRRNGFSSSRMDRMIFPANISYGATARSLASNESWKAALDLPWFVPASVEESRSLRLPGILFNNSINPTPLPGFVFNNTGPLGNNPVVNPGIVGHQGLGSGVIRLADDSPGTRFGIWYRAAADPEAALPLWYLNALGYYPPARALVVKGTRRIHTNSGNVFGLNELEAFKIKAGLLDNDRYFSLERARSIDGDFLASVRLPVLQIYNGVSVTKAVFTLDKPTERSEAAGHQVVAVRGLLDLEREQASNEGPLIQTLIDAQRKGEPLAGPLFYERWQYQSGADVFTDLVAYAPDMNTSLADVLAVLEAEASKTKGKPGTIDPAARSLLTRARTADWQSLAVPAGQGQEAFEIRFDGMGRFAYDRVLPEGLLERVCCNGETLTHLYPEIGIGAKREVSRFHRADYGRLLPWLAPLAEDLAQGCDVRCIDSHTVAVIPHGSNERKDKADKPEIYPILHLVFGADGKLAERQLVEMPSHRILLRQTYAKGEVRLVDGNGKELARLKTEVKPAPAPNLKPDVSNLVVLPLPWRTPEYAEQKFKIDLKKGYASQDDTAAIAFLAATFAGYDKVTEIWRQRYQARGDKRPGFYTLVAAKGAPVQPETQGALERYLALVSDPEKREKQQIGDLSTNNRFISRLAAFHDLVLRLSAGKDNKTEQVQDRGAVLAFIRQNNRSPFGWALLSLVKDQEDPDFQRALAEVYAPYAELPGLEYAARYERGVSLLKGGQRKQAQEVFLDLYQRTLEAGVLPPIDAMFHDALAGTGAGETPWSRLMRETSVSLVKENQRSAAIALAWQCRQLGDPRMADAILDAAIENMPADERADLSVLAIAYAWASLQFNRAEMLLQPLLADDKLAGSSNLWRIAAAVACQRGDVDAFAVRLEKALDIEAGTNAEGVPVETVRHDYALLFEQYQRLAESLQVLHEAPEPALLARIIRAADHWRSLDPDPAACSQAAAGIFATLGATELAWEYLTTPVAQQPHDSGTWLQQARTLRQRHEAPLADRAYVRAFAAEPTNAEILSERADFLQESGRFEEARALFRQLAAGPWQRRFDNLRQTARQRLEGK